MGERHRGRVGNRRVGLRRRDDVHACAARGGSREHSRPRLAEPELVRDDDHAARLREIVQHRAGDRGFLVAESDLVVHLQHAADEVADVRRLFPRMMTRDGAKRQRNVVR